MYHVDCADKSAWSKVRSSRDFRYIFSRTCALAFELRPVYCSSAAPRPPCTAAISRCCRCDNLSHVAAATNDVALQTLQVMLTEALPTHRVTHTALRFPRAVDCETGCWAEGTRPPRELGLLVAPCMDYLQPWSDTCTLAIELESRGEPSCTAPLKSSCTGRQRTTLARRTKLQCT